MKDRSHILISVCMFCGVAYDVKESQTDHSKDGHNHSHGICDECNKWWIMSIEGSTVAGNILAFRQAYANKPLWIRFVRESNK